MSKSEMKPLPSSATVMRIVRCIDMLIVPGYEKPLPAAFNFSSEEREETKKTNTPARLSVFDKSKTTIDQAKKCRNIEGELRAFGLVVSDIRSIALPKEEPRLDVVEDPINSCDGGEGHAGIVGLQRKQGEPKKYTKMLRSKLVDCCELLDDEPCPSS